MSTYDDALTRMTGPAPDIGEVRRLLDAAILAGDDRAEYALATWYLHGTHVEKDLRAGTRLLERAAAKGNAAAAFDLAVCFETGQGVGKSETKAFALYKAAAERGDAGAMLEVGRMLYYGLGIAEDRKAAAHWLAKAETLGAREPETLAG